MSCAVLVRCLAALTLATSLAGCVVQPVEPGRVAVARVVVAPPPLPVYELPPCPGDGYLWIPGYWQWGADDYFWVPGTWMLPPRAGLLWTPGYWGFVGGVYVFHDGYWGRHVGYYGGIDYGGGYNGSGFVGGRWVHDRFYYNAAVTNVNLSTVHNVYRQTVVNNVTINNTRVSNVSYAGGPGGTTVTPSAAERAAARAPRVAPLPVQRQQRDAARSHPELFATRNGGHPPIAATPHPGAFTAPRTEARRTPPEPRPGRHERQRRDQQGRDSGDEQGRT
ncbi:MAG: YXWGXW repeat-containing protein [Gammaproteobacteria bacterium]|nr:YXWGXW repeat-containing protein [Gammaproteobacteria bacterium]